MLGRDARGALQRTRQKVQTSHGGGKKEEGWAKPRKGFPKVFERSSGGGELRPQTSSSHPSQAESSERPPAGELVASHLPRIHREGVGQFPAIFTAKKRTEIWIYTIGKLTCAASADWATSREAAAARPATAPAVLVCKRKGGGEVIQRRERRRKPVD